MFLIYNFHLSESLVNLELIDQFMNFIQKILHRELTDIDYNFMNIYGKEAFCLTCLTGVNEISLMRNWKRINNLYTIFCYDNYENNMDFSYMEEHFNLEQYFKYSSDIDKNLNRLKKNKMNNLVFLSVLKNVCPFLKNSIEKRG